MEITEKMITNAVHVLQTWGGLCDRRLDEHAIARRMLEAALKATKNQEVTADT